jgi:hypothetical protein
MIAAGVAIRPSARLRPETRLRLESPPPARASVHTGSERMKREIRTACAGAAVLMSMAAMQDAQAQRAPWWERQKAAQAAAQADGGDVATQADAAQSPVRPSWSQAPAVRREK